MLGDRPVRAYDVIGSTRPDSYVVIPRRCECSSRWYPAGPLAVVLASAFLLAGCSDPAQGLIRKVAARVTNAPWHEQHGWRAADFFTDPQVIALSRRPHSEWMSIAGSSSGDD